jgi:ferredoxin
MKRKIIKIDEDKCNGCGLCVPACHEGAIKIVDGKARLSADFLCDGLGACLGECPQGAIVIEEREAADYNETKVLKNVIQEGQGAVAAHLQHLADHDQTKYIKEAEQYMQQKGPHMKQGTPADKALPCGCPGSMTRDFRKEAKPPVEELAGGSVSSQLQQWPVQLRLLNPASPFFQNADLVVAADCVPFTYANFHQKFLKGKILAVFCPKLDEDVEEYVAKLATIFKENNIRSVTVIRMEVPCCGGTVSIVEEALHRSGRNVIMKEYMISLRGEII